MTARREARVRSGARTGLALEALSALIEDGGALAEVMVRKIARPRHVRAATSAIYRSRVSSAHGRDLTLDLELIQLSEVPEGHGFALLALASAALDPMPDVLVGSLPKALASDPDELFGLLQDLDEDREQLDALAARFIASAHVEPHQDGARLHIVTTAPDWIDHLAAGRGWDGYFVGA